MQSLSPLHHAIEVLEFDKILRNIAGRCHSQRGRETALSLAPLFDETLIRARQELVEEIRQLLATSGQPELAGLSDPEPHIDKASKEGIIGEEQLWEIAQCARISHNLTRLAAQRERFPRLRALLDGIEDTPAVSSAIERFIAPPGVFKDDASERMAQLRIAKKEVHDRLQEKLNSMLVDEKYAGFWQEELITLRNERFVLPLKSEHKLHIPSVIHDRSASGATVFVEPLEIVPFNNQLRELELEEREEKLRILRNICGIVAAYAPQILTNLQILHQLDFFVALAQFADALGANPPAVAQDTQLRILDARHPILILERGKEAVIPLDMELTMNTRCVLITGPNMGGKTVALKTIGLLSMMAACGLPIPADTRTQIPLYADFFADIGDEQSVEASISSFASHIVHYRQALENAGSHSLVLFDELGSSTDPQEGTPLSWALVEALLSSGATVIANTHLGGLMAIAATRDDVRNAAMEFDQSSMKPTYRMMLGIPGRSWATEIAGMLGLPEKILVRARELAEGGSALDKIIADLQRRLREVEDIQNRLHAEQVDMRQKREMLEVLISANRTKEKEIERLRRAYEEQRDTRIAAALERELEKFRAQWENIVSKAPPEPSKRRDADEIMTGLRARLRHAERSIAQRQGLPKQLEEGQRVFIYRLHKWADVMDDTDEQGFVRVLAGNLPLRIHSSGVDTEEEYERKRRRKRLGARKDNVGYERRAVPQKLDVRGMRPDEAWDIIDHILDDAVASDTPQVFIIHGKGKGILRRFIRDKLHNDSRVAQLKLPEEHEGGDGAIIAIIGEKKAEEAIEG